VGSVLAFAWFLFRWKKFVVRHLVIKSKNREITFDQGKIGAIDKLLTVAIAFLTILVILEVTDRSVNTLIAFGGIGGLALAFASQEIIANFFGGFMIYLTQPFTVGDWIQLPDHSIEGNVEEIGWYMTRVRSLDKKPIYVPNAIFSKLIVITPSRMSHRQFKETIGVRYDDLSKTQAICTDIREMLQQHLDIDRSLPIIVRLSAFGSYSLDIYVSAYTQTTDTDGFMRVKEDVLYRITAILAKHGAELAFPTQNLSVSYSART
jgi:MscS family membrane protein